MSIKKAAIYVALFVLFVGAFFSVFYLSHTYIYLVNWFYSLNSCFYKCSSFRNDFFTQKVKSAGNFYCSISLLISVFSIAYLIKLLRRKNFAKTKINFNYSNLSWLIAICVAGFIFWLWGTTQTPPSSDEIFSAVNCAAIHPFQTMAYYMLPNNHIFYNLLNNIVFHFASDKVLTGAHYFINLLPGHIKHCVFMACLNIQKSLLRVACNNNYSPAVHHMGL